MALHHQVIRSRRVSNTHSGVPDTRPAVSNSHQGVFKPHPGVSDTLPGVYNTDPGVSNIHPGVSPTDPGVPNTRPGVKQAGNRTISSMHRVCLTLTRLCPAPSKPETVQGYLAHKKTLNPLGPP